MHGFDYCGMKKVITGTAIRTPNILKHPESRSTQENSEFAYKCRSHECERKLYCCLWGTIANYD